MLFLRQKAKMSKNIYIPLSQRINLMFKIAFEIPQAF